MIPILSGLIVLALWLAMRLLPMRVIQCIRDAPWWLVFVELPIAAGVWW